MSIRTIVEINHDLAHNIDQNSEQFLSLLVYYLRTGDRRDEHRLRTEFGFRMVVQGHHSDSRQVTFNGTTVNL